MAADIASDPRWHDFKELALTHGLRACWSVPILGDAGRVLGTFAFYYDEPRGALPSELAIIEGGAYLASLAIDRHQKTLARERNADRLALATRAGGVGIWEYDIAANRLVWDDQMYRLYGIAPDQFSGEYEAWRTGLHPDDVARADQEISRALAGENEFNTEFRVIWPDGTTHHIRALAIVQRAPDGQPRLMIGTNWDITDQKQAEEKQRQFERKMLDTQKLESLGVLAGGIAHDFNNLLTGILGNASLASLDLPTGSPIQDNLRAIQQGSLRAADLCRQMLAYSGKGRFVVNNLGLNRLIEDTTPLVQLSISKHAVLRFNLHRELPAIEADATQIRQVIMNLVINASEAIGEKSGVITLNTGLTRVDRAYLGGTILAPELPEGTYVYLEVSDSGCGMDAETQAKIFDPFYTTKFSGRGLGLAAVLGIVRGHKGVLKVYSEPGRGTTFKLLFPCAAGSESVLPERVEAKVLPGQGCILVVDDEETVRSTAALMLRKMGFEVALTNDGREAVAAFRAQPDRYRLVLTDLTMPHLDGEQVFTELRAIRAEVAVILMSGFNEEEASVRFTGKGLASFIQKPFEFGQLSKIVHGALAGSPRAT